MAEEKLRTDELLPLDQAIIWSIDHCGKSLVICVRAQGRGVSSNLKIPCLQLFFSGVSKI